VPLPLKSWTRTVPEHEGLALIDLAEPGMSVDAWRAAADAALPHADASYRQTLTRIVLRMLVDVDGDVLIDTPFRRLVVSGSPRLRHDLFYARYGVAHPWTLLALGQVVLPRLDADEDGARVGIDEWDAFVLRFVEEGTSEASRRKTRSTVIGALQQLGVVDREGPSHAPTRLRRGDPDPLAFAWVLADQLAGQLLPAVSVEWATTRSDAAWLFALRPDAAERCLLTALEHDALLAVEVDGEPGISLPRSWA
jgi:hypothetical protein